MEEYQNGEKPEASATFANAKSCLDALEDQEETQEIIEQKLINEEYKIWKKNSPFLYDMIYACVPYCYLPRQTH